jgi:PAS domain S-box-containing protein
VNYEGKFLYVNEEWKRVLGYTEEDLAKIDISKVIRCDQLPDCLELFKKVVVDGTSIIDHETSFCNQRQS